MLSEKAVSEIEQRFAAEYGFRAFEHGNNFRAHTVQKNISCPRHCVQCVKCQKQKLHSPADFPACAAVFFGRLSKAVCPLFLFIRCGSIAAERAGGCDIRAPAFFHSSAAHAFVWKKIPPLSRVPSSRR
jgi:hypothetical protein